MQKDRKSKLADAFVARRKKQLACYLASSLGVAVTTSVCLMPANAFDAPPPSTQPKTFYMGSVGVGTPGSGSTKADATSNSAVDNEHASNTEALKRVGIRFVSPENQAKTNAAQLANQSIPPAPNVIQPPMVIAGPGTVANAQGSADSSVSGIRIRIPSDKTSSVGGPAASAVHTSSKSSSSGTFSAPAPVANPTTPNLKITVGTGIPPLPAIASTAAATQSPPAELKTAPALAATNTSVPVTFGPSMTTATAASRATELPALPATSTPVLAQSSNQAANVAPRSASLQASTQTGAQGAGTIASTATGFAIPTQTPPSFAAPSVSPSSSATQAPATPAAPKLETSNVAANKSATPNLPNPSESQNIQQKTNGSQASLAVSGSKLQARLQDSSSMTSRAPGIVRIPSMVVAGATAPSAESNQATTAEALRTNNNVNASSSIATAKPLPKPGFVGNGSAIELPMLQPSSTQMMQSRTPSLESRSLKHSSPQAALSSAPVPSAGSNSSGFHSLPSTIPQPASLPRVATAVSAESLAQTASQSIELVEKAIGPTAASMTPKLIPATARTNPRYEPSIIPVALLSPSAPKETATASPNGQFESTSRMAEQAYAENSITEQSPSENQSLALMPGPVAAPVNSTITVALKNVQTIRLPGKVSQVEIEDDTVCRVISTEPNTLTIIGASIGESKITIWSTNPTTKADETQDFKVSVRETWGQAAKNTVSIDDVNQSIAALFPGSSVVIKPNSDGSISVQGSATSNESAKQILMLVRKMFLVPVQDRIAIANL